MTATPGIAQRTRILATVQLPYTSHPKELETMFFPHFLEEKKWPCRSCGLSIIYYLWKKTGEKSEINRFWQSWQEPPSGEE